MDRQADAANSYREAEAEFSAAAEEFVGRPRFASTLALAAENVAAAARISGELFDLTLRNLRLVSRRDLVNLAKQLNRTEDKLERVLQEVEALRQEGRRPESEASEEPTTVEHLKAAKE